MISTLKGRLGVVAAAVVIATTWFGTVGTTSANAARPRTSTASALHAPATRPYHAIANTNPVGAYEWFVSVGGGPWDDDGVITLTNRGGRGERWSSELSDSGAWVTQGSIFAMSDPPAGAAWVGKLKAGGISSRRKPGQFEAPAEGTFGTWYAVKITASARRLGPTGGSGAIGARTETVTARSPHVPVTRLEHSAVNTGALGTYEFFINGLGGGWTQRGTITLSDNPGQGPVWAAGAPFGDQGAWVTLGKFVALSDTAFGGVDLGKLSAVGMSSRLKPGHFQNPQGGTSGIWYGLKIG